MSTEYQGVGSMILSEIGFESMPSLDPDGNLVCGGNQTFKPTSDTVAFVQSMVDNSQILVLDGDGTIRKEDA